MRIKVSDYIVKFLIKQGVTDVFGYPGGVVCHILDSFCKESSRINTHITYHEQAASFAACSYAQVKGVPGVCFATSGPGATNLITGIANAYYDNIPAVFITGQVDTYVLDINENVKQKGFQETDVISIVKGITKVAVQVKNSNDMPQILHDVWLKAITGKKGPVLLDLPADVQREMIDVDEEPRHIEEELHTVDAETVRRIKEVLLEAKRPCVLLGNGVKQYVELRDKIVDVLEELNIPCVSSLPAMDVLPSTHHLNMGYIGANGHRSANFVLSKCDCLLTLGTRLDLKQVGNRRVNFAPNAKIIRVDIDDNELNYKVHDIELSCNIDSRDVINIAAVEHWRCNSSDWIEVCTELKDKIKKYDFKHQHIILEKLSNLLGYEFSYTIDVGQSMLWSAQSLNLQKGQCVCMSAGHGSMGYSLPASIGLYHATNRPVCSINGDGGIQMNLQEMQYFVREKIPVTIILINNKSLGMIRQFQEKNFNKVYFSTIEDKGYSVPNFSKIAEAYGYNYYKINTTKDVDNIVFNRYDANFIEIELIGDTYLEPNWGRSEELHNQLPEMISELYTYLNNL